MASTTRLDKASTARSPMRQASRKTCETARNGRGTFVRLYRELFKMTSHRRRHPEFMAAIDDVWHRGVYRQHVKCAEGVLLRIKAAIFLIDTSIALIILYSLATEFE
ncbi:unnamed protein product [Leptosia nina]|uniref:Uncharacterized protein n=1 Tax=Leptosia nina TaxID=320188 RepID=A0AAV1IYU9_9NEOP